MTLAREHVTGFGDQLLPLNDTRISGVHARKVAHQPAGYVHNVSGAFLVEVTLVTKVKHQDCWRGSTVTTY